MKEEGWVVIFFFFLFLARGEESLWVFVCKFYWNGTGQKRGDVVGLCKFLWCCLCCSCFCVPTGSLGLD